MTLWRGFLRLLRPELTGGTAPVASGLQLTMTSDCLQEIRACIKPALDRRHEAICYLFGRTDGTSTRIEGAIRPAAVTTAGSFKVDAPSMAAVVRAAVQRGQQVVGQLHTHPREAYHSVGDEQGARIRYKGYVSIVLPDYGAHLPSLKGTAMFIYQPGAGFVPLSAHRLQIVQDGWRA